MPPALLKDDDKTSLRLFCRICSDLINCRFWREFANQDHSIRGTRRDDGTWDCYEPSYDRDDLRSFITICRQVLAGKDKTYIHRIIKILNAHLSDTNERDRLSQIQKNLDQLLNFGWGFQVKTKDAAVTLAALKLWEMKVYGEILHRDSERQEALGQVDSFGAFFDVAFVEFSINISTQAINIANIISRSGLVQCN